MPAARNSDSKVSAAALADGREVVGDTDGRDGEGDAVVGLFVGVSVAGTLPEPHPVNKMARAIEVDSKRFNVSP